MFRMMRGLLGVLQRALDMAELTKPQHAGGTPNIHHKSRSGQTRAQAPNDSGWHMKFHRSRH